MGKKDKAPPSGVAKPPRNPPQVDVDSDDEPPPRVATRSSGRNVTTTADVHRQDDGNIDDIGAAADVESRNAGPGQNATTGGSGGISKERRTAEERQKHVYRFGENDDGRSSENSDDENSDDGESENSRGEF